MVTNPIRELGALGQSVWIDFIRRDMLLSGALRRLIAEDGLCGLTSNPAIFEKAIAGSEDYDIDIGAMARDGMDVLTILEELSLRDLQEAADELRGVYEATDGKDGYASLEINPHLAHDADASLMEARRLWKRLDRPNVFIKIPATREGLPVIEELIAEGINVNVTLIFGLPRYREVVAAYFEGLSRLTAGGRKPPRVASVASFFVSRIDSLVDRRLKDVALRTPSEAEHARSILGEVAVDSARSAYLIFKDLHGDAKFGRLAQQGARPQRLLWASTSTKDPAYSDVKYVEALIGADTVNTMPPETIDAYRNHGNPAPRLGQELAHAGWALRRAEELGLDMEALTQQLEDEGVDKFKQAFDTLLDSLTKKVSTVVQRS